MMEPISQKGLPTAALVALVLFTALVITACGAPRQTGAIAVQPEAPGSARATDNPTRPPQVTATTAPRTPPAHLDSLPAEQPGIAGNPLILLAPAALAAGEIKDQWLARTLSAATGLEIRSETAESGVEAAERLCSGEAHAAILRAPVVLTMEAQGCASPAATAIQRGETAERGEIIARIDTGVASLEDLASKPFCRPDAQSPTGWVMPSLLMRLAGVDPDSDLGAVIDSGSDTDVVRRVVSRECAAGGTYEGARIPLTGEILGLMEWTAVIGRTERIPHDTLVLNSSVPAEIRDSLLQALISLSGSEEQQVTLLSQYGWEGFAPADRALYEPLYEALRAAGVDFESFLSP